MRLLNTSTLEVQEFLESRVPEYVILSHTWRDEEVTLQDLLSGKAPTKKGYAKLTGCCKKAKDDGFAYCWIDTCCIDKTSSAELSEAINSMYQWYKNAEICYVYLEDICQNPVAEEADNLVAFAFSKWFTRGWTLQELIAPPIVEFYDVFWSEIGTRSSLQQDLTKITGINRDVLTGEDPLKYAVAVRLSWAARRQTSRLEDQAYCLLGILGVNMPLLYGEGKRAFRRLQEELLRVDEDYTLFAWDAFSTSGEPGVFAIESLLATSPSDFETFLPEHDLVSVELGGVHKAILRDNLSKTCFSVLPPPEDHSPPRLTSRGCHLSLPLFRYEESSWYGCLACWERPKSDSLLLCVMLRQVNGSETRFERDWDTAGEQSTLIFLPASAVKDFHYASIYVTTSMEDHWQTFASDVQDEGHSMVQLVIDPALRSEILHKPSDRTEARSCAVEETHTTYGLPLLPLPSDASDWYHGKQNDNFQFRFVHTGGLDLIVVVYVHVNHNPYFTVEIGPSIKSPDVRTGSLLTHTPPPFPISQSTPDRSLDRKTLQIQHLTDDNDPAWPIHVSIRRAGRARGPSEQQLLDPYDLFPMHDTPNAKKYVLELAKHRLPLS